MPIFMDRGAFSNIRADVLQGKNCTNDARKFMEKDILSRRSMLRKGAKTQLKQSMDHLERKTHEKLVSIGLHPEGKKLLESKYGPFTVTDNYFRSNGVEYAVFVSNSDIRGVIGSSAIVKEMVCAEIKTIGVVLEPDRRGKPHPIEGYLLTEIF